MKLFESHLESSYHRQRMRARILQDEQCSFAGPSQPSQTSRLDLSLETHETELKDWPKGQHSDKIEQELDSLTHYDSEDSVFSSVIDGLGEASGT
jgi:hypothetical protein